jgi:hypothetical protein
MSTARCFAILFLFCTSLAAAGCATVIEGPMDRVRYEGGPGALAFYNAEGKQIPSDHEFDDGEGLHFNFIELDKGQSEHVITARHGDLMQRDTLRRKFGYGWLVPNALLIYSFPVFTGIDLLTSSIYSFPPPRLRLAISDSIGLPAPVPLTIVDAETQRRAAQRIMLGLHSGMLTPASDNVGLPPAYGIVGGYHHGDELWTTLGYNYSSKLEQQLGYAQRAYDTEVHSVEATLQYAPIKFGYLLAGIGFDHLVFQLASKPDDPEKRFGRNVMTGGFGAGLTFGSLFVELRRNLALSRIETPEGPGHYVQFTHIRAGVVMRFAPSP